MTDTVPGWLNTARQLKGLLEAPGAADNPVILGWPSYIAQRWPEMADYTKGYTHDSIAWCGLFVAYCLSANGVRPPFDPSEDTRSFLFADSYAHNWGTPVGAPHLSPQLGDVCVFTRDGGGHVAFYEGEDGSNIIVTGGNQSDSVSTIREPKSRLTGIFRPPSPEKLPVAGNIPAPASAPARVPTAATTAEHFSTCLATVLKWEGGNDNDPRDPGGRTSRGILQSEWNAWRLSHPGLPSDVWQAPQDQIVAIYLQKYWNVLHCDELPAGVDLAVFDFGVNSGNSRAAKYLQRIVGTPQDGEIGPITLAATASRSPNDTVSRLCDDRMTFLRGIKTWPTFGRGWTSRVTDVRATAMAMALETKPQSQPLEPIPVTDTPVVTPAPAPAPSPLDDFGAKFQAYKTAHPEEFAQAKQGVGALLMVGIKFAQAAFPQFAIFGTLAQLVLANAGVMGMAAGDAATPTGQVTGAALVSMLASWAVSKINTVTQK